MSTITVSNTAGLTAALKTAHDGDTISLKAGTYSGLDFNHVNFASGVTITSADPLHEAVLTNFHVGDSSGLHFSNLDFQANGGAGSLWGFQVENSKNISFDHLNVHGTDANPQNDAEGIGVWGSANVSITNSEFHQLARGATFGEGSNLVVTGNSFHDLRTTGIMVGQTAKADISNNSFTNFKIVAGDHPDAIQFITTGTTSASHDINITGNVITRGTGDAVQGIFLRDEVGTLHYTNVNIANNLLIGTGYNGIAVLGGQNVAVTNNMLQSYAGDTNVTWVMVQSSDNVTASGNTAKSFIFDQDTHLTETGDVHNAATTDNGQSALATWLKAHPTMGAVIGDQSLISAVQAQTPVVTPTPALVTQNTAPNTIAAPVATTTVTNGVVSSTSSVTLDGANNNLVLKGTGNINGVGNNKGDNLAGNSGNNHLTGGTGADTIDGGAGYDTLTGGSGVDTFHFTPGNVHDVITDFGAGGKDVLDLSGYLKMNLRPVFHDVGHDVALTFSNGDSISITGVNSWNLHATSTGFTA